MARTFKAGLRIFPEISSVWLLAAVLTVFMAASSAPTPLYRLYQDAWGFSSALLTAVFGVYALSLLAALLTLGALSDVIGRRPMILISILLEIAAMALFWGAGSVLSLIVARVVQGVATGIAASALGAAIFDADKHRAPLINGVVPMLGMGGGALLSGLLAAYGPAPTQIIFVVLMALLAGLGFLIWRDVPETVERRTFAIGQLRPRMQIPPQARGMFLMISPVNIAVWALGGFYLSLVPSLVRLALHSASPLVGGGVVAVLTFSGAVAIALGQRFAPHSLFKAGALCLAVGPLLVLAGVQIGGTALLFIGTALAGVGFGIGFLGSLRLLLPLAHPGERAGLMAAFYVMSYLANCLPSLAAGFAAQQIGLAAASYWYGGAVAALSLSALTAIAWRRRKVV